MLKQFSLSVRRADPDGAYTLTSFSPLYSTDMARPEGNLCAFVFSIACFTSFAVPRIVVSMLWWVSYPLKLSVSGFVTSWRSSTSSPCLFMNGDSIPTLVVADIQLMLSVAILMIYIPGRLGVQSWAGTIRVSRSCRAPVGVGCNFAQSGAHQSSLFSISFSV